MPDDTNPAAGTSQGGTQDDAAVGSLGLFTPIKILEGQELYDQIMGQIEPELTSASIPLLEEKYRDETSEEAELRRQRYNKAYEEYDRQYAGFLSQKEVEFQAHKRQAIASIEKEDRKEEEAQLGDLESAISNS